MGACRAAFHLDWPMEEADRERIVACPVLALFGESGLMAKQFDVPAEWRRCCANVTGKAMPGGHFFIDTAPGDTLQSLREFLAANA